MKIFDPHGVLKRIRGNREVAQHCTYHMSKLNMYRAELVALHKEGGSLSELQAWLRIDNNLKATRSTISRYLKKLPELQ